MIVIVRVVRGRERKRSFLRLGVMICFLLARTDEEPTARQLDRKLERKQALTQLLTFGSAGQML